MSIVGGKRGKRQSCRTQSIKSWRARASKNRAWAIKMWMSLSSFLFWGVNEHSEIFEVFSFISFWMAFKKNSIAVHLYDEKPRENYKSFIHVFFPSERISCQMSSQKKLSELLPIEKEGNSFYQSSLCKIYEASTSSSSPSFDRKIFITIFLKLKSKLSGSETKVQWI